MVATLVRLRLLLLRNSLRRSTGQLVAVIFGALYGLLVLGVAVAGLFGMNVLPVELVRIVVVLAGSALTLGWAVVPLFLSVEQTLDAPHLAVYPIRLNTLLVGLLISGIVAVPGGVTMIAAVFTFGSWLRMPGVAVIALVCGVAGAALCVALSRAVTSAAAGLTAGRRFREAAGILVLVPVILVGPIVFSTAAAIGDAHAALPALADGLSWTPLGAIWAIPALVALGDPIGAVLRMLIGAATFAVVIVVWRWGLARALVTPVHATARVRASGRIGWFGRLPATPVGAVAARCLTYWFRDPRYLRQLVVVPVMVALFSFYRSTSGEPGVLLVCVPVIAFIFGIALISDVSYDSTAFVLHMTTSVPGRTDRWGRVSAVLTFALPVVVAVGVGVGAVSGQWAALPAVLGVALGLLLGGLAVSAVTSAIVVFPAPRPGDGPFKTRPGANTALLGASFLSFGVVAVIVAPEIALLIVRVVTGQAIWGWLGLVVGAVLGGVLLRIGVRQGGRILDHRAPELLLQLQASA